MEKFSVFRFCLCDNTEVEKIETKNAITLETVPIDYTKKKIKENGGVITDSADVKVLFVEGYENQTDEVPMKLQKTSSKIDENMERNCTRVSPQNMRSRPKSGTFEEASKSGVASPSTNGHVLPTQEQKSKETASLHDLVRDKRIALRKRHAKLKIDLNSLQKMREMLDANRCACSANLPDVVTSESNSTEEEFLNEFKQIFDGAVAGISNSAQELQNLTDKYSVRLKTILSKSRDSSDEESPSQITGESNRLASDSEIIVSMLHKAAEIAVIESKLKQALSSKNLNRKEIMKDLESVLLDMQRLKSTTELGFHEKQRGSSSEGASCTSIRELFGQLFPPKRLLKLEKHSKLKLAELHIEALENRNRQDEARNHLSQAIVTRVEKDLISALKESDDADVSPDDELRVQAKNILTEKEKEIENCRNELETGINASSIKAIQKALKKAELLCIPSDDLLLKARQNLKELEEKEEKLKQFTTQLKHAMKKRNVNELQKSLVNIKTIKITTGMKIVEDATNLLMCLKKHDQDHKRDAIESTRMQLANVLDCENKQDIADALLRAQMAGLSNSVEIMAGRAKLALLQNNNERFSAEVKIIEDYLEKLVKKASDNTATVDLIMTLERAITVANKIDVSSDSKQRAQGALHVLNSRKEKVKHVKDELQRAVMECRQEAIACAIAEAESLPYFLTFDPLDGQIAAILEYAKNKIIPLENMVIPDKHSTVHRVKSNLKRAMRGHSSTKLESAITLFRKTYNIPDDKPSVSIKLSKTVNGESADLMKKAERKYRRMRREEELAESEWDNIRKTLRENLKSATKGNDRAELWKAVYQFKRELGSSLEKEDEILLTEARKHLRKVTMEQFKTNLTSAIEDRDSARLRHSLVELDSPSLSIFPINPNGKFKEDIVTAKKLLNHLKEMEKLKKSVAELSRSQLAEIHRYPNPPTCVRAVMTATYILLGENEKELKDWTAVHRLMVKMGRESLTRRVAISSATHIPAATAKRVEEILSIFSPAQVRDINKVAAIFFAWAKCFVDEVIELHKNEPCIATNPKQSRTQDKSKEAVQVPVKSEFWNRLSRPRSSFSVRSIRSVQVKPRPTSAMK